MSTATNPSIEIASAASSVANPMTGRVARDVFLRFDDQLSNDKREEFVRCLRALSPPDFEVIEDGEICLRMSSHDENAALVRAQVVVQGMCKAIEIDPDLIRRTLDPD
jgi:hypothetical protein